MTGRGSKGSDYSSLRPVSKNTDHRAEEQQTLKSLEKRRLERESEGKDELSPKPKAFTAPENGSALPAVQADSAKIGERVNTPTPDVEKTYAEIVKEQKAQKAVEGDRKLLAGDKWLARSGHALTYVGVFLFTVFVYFRPYEWYEPLSGFKSAAFYIALVTLAIYLPTQLATEGNLTIMTTEVKCLLFMTFWALLLMPVSKDPSLAWSTFNEQFLRIVLVFIVMANTLRTRARLTGLMSLSLGVGLMLSYQAISAYQRGEFKIEGYRVETDLGGMFGNPNDTALHLVMFTPIAVVLGIISRNLLLKILYFSAAGIMVIANFVTQSRGGFLGLIAIYLMMAWKLSKKNRLNILLISAALGILVLVFAPGNYGKRILSIFVPGLDDVGSHDQRRELLIQSIIVTMRNPWGVGMGNFTIVSIRNLVSHNSFTQISAELGLLAFAAYMTFMVSPFRKLGAMVRQLDAKDDHSWLYYMAIGLQTCILGYMVSSFFVSVAYTWFIYYPIAYAICLRRIYQLEQEKEGQIAEYQPDHSNYFRLSRV
jgi:O-antigen ligase